MKKVIAMLLTLTMVLGISGAFAATLSIDTSALTSGQTPVITVTKQVTQEDGTVTEETVEYTGLAVSADEDIENEVADAIAEIAADETKTVLDIYKKEETKAAVANAMAADIKAANPEMTDAEVKAATEAKKANMTVTAAVKVVSNQMLEILETVNEGKPEAEKVTEVTVTVDVAVTYNPEEKVYPVLLIPTGTYDENGNEIFEEIVLTGVVDANGKVKITYPIEVLEKMKDKDCKLNIISEKDAVPAA